MPRNWTTAEVRAIVREICLDADPPMKIHEWEARSKGRPDLPSASTVQKHLANGKGWATALSNAGCPARRRGRAGQTDYLLERL